MSAETMGERHLDDEQLSALLDDGGSGDDAHLSSCAACSARFEALQAARDAVAGATVAPLADDALDRLVATAVAAAPHLDPAIVPLSRGRRRVPPPAWLVGVAAVLLLFVGVSAMVRSVGGRGTSAANVALTSGHDDAGEAAHAGGASKSSGAGAAAAGAAADSNQAFSAEGSVVAGSTGVAGDPEVVTFDLADQHDPSELAVLLRDRSTASAGGRAAADQPGAGTAAPVAPTPQPSDRARCRASAESSGDGAIGALLSTGTVRWKGQAAEVLVFELRTPTSDGLTRQAMVLARPGCELLAEQRF